MKYLKILVIILFVNNNLMAQKETTYYMRITSDLVYTIQNDSNGLTIASNVSVIDEILNNSNLKEFERVFPEFEGSANEIHYVVCANDNLVEELSTEEIKLYIPLVEKLDGPVLVSRYTPINITSQKSTFWQ